MNTEIVFKTLTAISGGDIIISKLSAKAELHHKTVCECVDWLEDRGLIGIDFSLDLRCRGVIRMTKRGNTLLSLLK